MGASLKQGTGTVKAALSGTGQLPANFGVCVEGSAASLADETPIRRIKILLVEDNANDAELMIAELDRLGFLFDWERVDSEGAYLGKLDGGIDLILSDFAMPNFGGMRALELLKNRPELDIPFIIISGTIGEETAVEAIQHGAEDYLIKDRLARLGPAVHRSLRHVEERRERQRLQHQFLEAQKMEVIGQLAAGVAHDFNNVLAVIMGYCDLIGQDIGGDHPAQKYAEEIRVASTRAAGLTRQLLIFSRKETVQQAEIDINEVALGMEKMLRRLVDENIEMTFACSKGLGLIQADSGYIWQLLMNLVVNARDAMPSGGRIELKTRSVKVDASTPNVPPDMPPGPYVVLSLSDSGCGMTEEVKARLFEPFFTTKPVGKGTGLGLATCLTIVRQSEGFIGLMSEPGRGTTFTIYFPEIARDGATPTKTAPLPQLVPRGTETLLIVEDEPSVRMLAHGVLKAMGYDVLMALNGQDALRVMRDHTGPPISLVVSDVVMPRMGGKALAECIRIIQPKIKILFTSGYTEESIVGQGKFERGVEFLPKPYAPATLVRKVREMLDAG